MADAITIDREFESLCGQQTPEELNLLEESLLEHGCLDPVLVWAGESDTLLDGHTRKRLCEQLGIGFKTKALKFSTREAARNWIIDNQLARRNLSDEQKSYLRGKRYNAEKKPKGGQFGEERGSSPKRTSEKLADQLGVTDRTIRNDGNFAAAVDTVAENAGPELKQEILSGKSGLTKKDVVTIAAKPAQEQAAAVETAKRESPRTGEIKTDVDRLIEGIESLIEKVNAMAARRMGHNDQSRAVVATLKDATKQSKAMAKSWRNI